MLAKAAFIAWDAALVVAAAVATWIAIGGGTEFTVAGHHVSAHSTGMSASIAATLAFCRLQWDFAHPFLGLPSLALPVLRQAWVQEAVTLNELMSNVAPATAKSLVWAGALVSFLVLAINAYLHFGFFGGDDMEVHKMTFNVLFGRDWPIWELRSAFYPMVFVYPVQAALVAAGFSDTSVLVLAGRLVVAALSTATLGVLYSAARRSAGVGVGLLAVFFFTVNRLHLAFGSTELPRPVATLFVVGAYTSLLLRSAGWTAAAGILIAIAGAMRFSECVFVVPAVAMLVCERRWRDAAILSASFAVALLLIQGAADYLYWGSPFASAIAITDYTLVQKLSSRGYEPAWFYLADMNSWSNVAVVGLAMYATWRGHWKPAIWAVVPLAVLSLLPHKEPRYLIPIMPFVALLAAYGMAAVLRAVSHETWLPQSRRVALASLVWLTFWCTVVYEAEGAHFRRTEREVEIARTIAAAPNLRGVAAEDVWRFGGQLYFRSASTVLDIDPASVETPRPLTAIVTLPGLSHVALRRRTCIRLECDGLMRESGYSEWILGGDLGADYQVFQRP